MLLPRAEVALGRGASPAAAAPRIVALGGGTGLPTLLRGLQDELWAGDAAGARADPDRLTAIVTVADDGGSSGRLRRAYGVLAPGDIRNCLLALSPGDRTLAALFGYRFNGRGELTGHSLGNLILTALSQLESRFDRAVERAGDMLGVRGRVLPATLAATGLVAEFEDGSSVEGECRIAAMRRPIRRVRLQAEAAPALPQALEAVASADGIVIGPGSLYTSLLPVLLVDGMSEAIARAGARVVLVMNLMTEPGETDGYTAADHVRAVRRHVPRVPIHDVLVSATRLAPAALERYAVQGAYPVRAERRSLRRLGCRPVERDLAANGPRLRHDPRKLAAALLEVITGTPWLGGPGA